MKKNKQLAIFMFIAFISSAIFFTGCENQIAQTGENTKETSNGENENSIKKTGTITGKALFSNSEDNSGIIITLEKTEENIAESVASIICKLNIENEEDMSRNISSRSIIGSTTTDSEGNYKFENVKTGSYTVYASSDHSSEKAVSTNISVLADTTATVADLKLTATGTISGIITLDNAESGNEAFLVFVAGTSYMAMTDTSGKYTISGVPAGTNYQLIVTKGKLTKTISTNVTVNANGNSTISDINFTSEDVNGTEEEKTPDLESYYKDLELSITYTSNYGDSTVTLSDTIDNPTKLGKGTYSISIKVKYCISAFSKEIYQTDHEECSISELLKSDPNFKITSSSDLISISEDFTKMTVNAATNIEELQNTITIKVQFNGDDYIYYLHVYSYEGLYDVDFASYIGNYSVKVRNKTSKNVVCFKGIPSKDTLISGAHGGDVITNLKLNTALFKESSDFVLYCISEEDYKKFGNDYDSMAQQPLARIYAYFNMDQAARDNLVYEISSNLGGEFYFNLDNSTAYNFEIRMDGLYGAPLCYSAARTLETKVYAQDGDYDLFPVLRQFDRRQGTIVTVFPQDENGDPMYVPVSLNRNTKAVRIDCSNYVGQGIKTFASCAYLKIHNGNAGGVALMKGATAEPAINDTGVSYINSGDDATYAIDMTPLGLSSYATEKEISGWYVGNRMYEVAIPTLTFQAGRLYVLNVEGTTSQPTCSFSDKSYEINLDE